MVFESYDEYAFGIKITFTFTIRMSTEAVEVSRTNELDCKLFRWTVEIEDVVSDRMLSDEFRPSSLEFFTIFQNVASAGVRLLRNSLRYSPRWGNA